jgi:hypothetical protein
MGVLQIVLFFDVTVLATKPVGLFTSRVFQHRRH